MFIGHAGIALGAVGLRPAIPLLALLLAAFGVDLLESALWLVGAAEATPRPAESVPVALALAVGGASVYGLVRHDVRGAAVLAAVALSHVPADLITGRVGLWPGEPVVGLNLFQMPLADWFVEAGLVLGGWALWRRSLPPAARRAPLTVGVLVGLLAVQAAFLVVLARM